MGGAGGDELGWGTERSVRAWGLRDVRNRSTGLGGSGGPGSGVSGLGAPGGGGLEREHRGRGVSGGPKRSVWAGAAERTVRGAPRTLRGAREGPGGLRGLEAAAVAPRAL